MLDKKKTMVQLDVGRIKEEREARVKVEEEDDELQSKSGGMVLTTTMEFCNNLKALEGQKKPVARTNPHVKPERKVQDTEEQEVGRRAAPASSSSKPGKWESKNRAEVQESETLIKKIYMTIDDSYGLLEADQCVIFEGDIDMTLASAHEKSLYQLLEEKQYLETTLMDQFISLVVEVDLQVWPTAGARPQRQSIIDYT